MLPYFVMPVRIHPTAIVDPKAEIDSDVEIGPFSVIRADVRIGKGTKIGSYVYIDNGTRIGENNKIFHHAVIGTAPQDLKYRGEKTFTEIGNNNIIREFVTINRATAVTGRAITGKTIIGNGSLLMAYVHVAHDCRVGNEVILANAVNMGGFVEIDDFAVVGGIVPIHQFVRVGKLAIIGAGLRIVQDICPYIKVDGPPARPAGLNSIGLKRRGFPSEKRRILKQAYRIIFRSSYNTSQALEALKNSFGYESHNESKNTPCNIPEVREIIDFISKPSRRGLLKSAGHKRAELNNNNS